MVLLMKPRATSTSEEYSGDVRSAAFGSRFIMLFRLARALRFRKAMTGIEAPNSTRAFARNVKQRDTPSSSKSVGWPESAQDGCLAGVLPRPSE